MKADGNDVWSAGGPMATGIEPLKENDGSHREHASKNRLSEMILLTVHRTSVSCLRAPLACT